MQTYICSLVHTLAPVYTEASRHTHTDTHTDTHTRTAVFLTHTNRRLQSLI